MKSRFSRALIVCLALLGVVVNRADSVRALTNGGNITAFGVALTESFDGLASSGTPAWIDNSTVPGVYSSRTAYTPGTGSSNTGALYSFGVAGTNPITERALGSVGSGGTGIVYWGVKLTNNTGGTITSLDISYVAEQWRNGGATSPNLSVAQTLDFQYQVANAGVITGVNAPTTNWLDYDPLDFTSPTFGTTAAVALDGNAPANRAAKSSTLNVTIASGQEAWLRWRDIDHPGNDHGFAVDDLSVTANGLPVTTTNPSGTMTANAQTYNIGDPITLTVNVTPGTNPASVGLSVTGNLAPINLGNPSFTDQGGNVFTFSGTIPSGVSGGSKSLTATITDSNSPARTGTTSPATPITILAPTPPTGSGSANPASVAAGGTTQLTVNVAPGTNPTSTGLAVTGNLSAIGGSAAQPFPLVTGNTFSVSATVAIGTPFGSTDLPITVSDVQGRSSTFSLPVIVTPPGAGIVRINEMDADTPGTDAAEFVELYDGGVGYTSLNGLVVVFFEGDSANNGTAGKLAYAAFDLDGYSTDANGYFVMGNPGVPGVSLIFDPGAFGLLSNGPDAVGLYIGNATDFPNGTDASTTNLQDAIVYGTDDPNASGLLPLLNAGQKIVNENATGNGTTQSSQRCPNGMGGFRNTSTYYPGTPTPGAASTCPAARPPSDVVISQVYGGGGNAGATYRNDFVELFNRGAAPVDLTGWSLQYASSTGSGWASNLQPLGGSIGGGQYYLVALASGGSNGASLPPANISGLINMAGASGKIALVSSFEGLVGGCPIYDLSIKDFVGYGSAADCGEGGTTTANGSNTAALYRKNNGATDTDNNAGDFNAPAPPNPRQTEPIIELGPLVLSRDPRANGFNEPRDATIQVIFTEPVTVDSAWFNLTCAISGPHHSATFASSFGGQDHFVTPNDNFIPGEQCTFTILKDRVHDVDSDDAETNTDTLPVDVSWSFTVASGADPAYPSSVHLTMGNPSNAGSDPLNYLMDKPEFTVSYNRDLGRPNWVSWHLSDEWVGTLARVDTFRPDPQIPPNWYRVQSFDFSGSGFDRGHMTPNADRDKETSVPINQATFLMTNMVAQAPAQNQGPWAAFEGYLRTLVEQNGEELYIVAGPHGAGGTGSLGGVTTTLASGQVTVPSSTWKVVLVLPKGVDDVSRVACSARTIAVVLPNIQLINSDWTTYLTTVDAVETLTGYDFFSTVPVPFQNCIEAGTNGNNPPLVKGNQTITFAAPADRTYGDLPFMVSATGGQSGNPVTFTASGSCTSGGLNGSTITIAAAGPCTVTASQAGSAAYNAAADVAHTLTVNKAVPSFSGLGSPIVEAGTPTVTLGGVVSLGALVPTGNVTITLNGVSQTVAVGPGGAFSASFATASLAPSATPYPVAYAYSGDTNFTPAAGTGSVTVVDSTAPSIGSVSVSHPVLSPPNHNMIDITIGYQVADATAAPVCSLSVSSSESINGNGDGNTSIDWQVIDQNRVQLRAERAGGGSGRIYTITIRCTDSSGNTGSATTTVTVPK